jgi:hypothetical protein
MCCHRSQADRQTASSYESSICWPWAESQIDKVRLNFASVCTKSAMNARICKYTYIYIYIYICMCVCVCVCVCV